MKIDPIAQDIVAVALAIAIMVLILQGRRIALRLGRIDAQVNNVPEGTPTLRQNVDTLIRDMRAVHERLDGFLSAEAIGSDMTTIHRRLDEVVAAIYRHHPDEADRRLSAQEETPQ